MMAYRLSRIVDIIFMVHDGVIAAEGTHEELLKSCDFYANLIRGWIECDRTCLFEYQQWGRIWGFPIAKQVMNQCATSSGMVGYDCMGRLVIDNTK